MKHLLSISDLSKAEALQILDTAQELSRISDAPVKKLPTLRARQSSISFSKTPLVLEFHLKQQPSASRPM